MTFGEIKFAIVSRNFFRVSRKYEANTLAAAARLLYDIRNAANQKRLVLAGAHAPAHRLCAN
jgi:hypothetical protein